MLAGKTSHSCWLSVQTVREGAGKSGSANEPTATQIISVSRSLVHDTVEPHVGQNSKVSQVPLSACRRKLRCSPWVETIWLRLKKAVDPKTAPVRRWQARQWQDDTRSGSPASRSRNCPQEHAASRLPDWVIGRIYR